MDKVTDEKLTERSSLNLWDNGNVSKDRAFGKKVDDLGKNVDDQGVSCLAGPGAPGMLAGVVGRVVSRPAVERDCESGSKGSSARYQDRWSQLPCGPKRARHAGWCGRMGRAPTAVESVCRDGAIQLLPLLEEALMAVETCARSTSERRKNGPSRVSEPLREQAQMSVALEPLLEKSPTTQESHAGANAERWEKPLRQEATMVLEPLREEARTTRESRVGANAERCWESL